VDCNLSILKTKFFLFYEKRIMCIYIYAAGLKLQNTIYAVVFYIYIYAAGC